MDVNRTKEWETADVLTAADLNAEFDGLLDSPGIVNADVGASAAIAESKLAFDTTDGHTHNGTDSKSVTTTGFSSGCRVTLSGNQEIPSGVKTKVTFDTEGWDLGGEFASNKFTATTAGYYLVVFSCYFVTMTDGITIRPGIYVNAGEVRQRIWHTGLTASIICGITSVLKLSADDYVEFYIRQDKGTAHDLIGNNVNTYGEIQRLA